MIVAGSLCGSVVAKTKIKWLGGSSSVFNSGLKALVESICTSSIINTLYFDLVGLNCALSIIFSRTLSTPVWLAASISITSMLWPAVISMQDEHVPHGSLSFSFLSVQFTDLA